MVVVVEKNYLCSRLISNIEKSAVPVACLGSRRLRYYLGRQIWSQRGKIFTARRCIYSKRSKVYCGKRERGYVFVRVPHRARTKTRQPLSWQHKKLDEDGQSSPDLKRVTAMAQKRKVKEE